MNIGLNRNILTKGRRNVTASVMLDGIIACLYIVVVDQSIGERHWIGWGGGNMIISHVC